MNHYIWVEVSTIHSSRLILKLFKARIEVLDIQYFTDKIQFKILNQDYKKLKKLVGYRFHKVRDDGFFHLKSVFQKKWFVFLGIFLFFLLLYVFSHVMVQVEVIHSNKEVRELVRNSLEDYGIHKLTWKKSFREIEQIKQNILKSHPNELEWLEIEVVGMKYIVRIEERILTIPSEKKERCHLIASKSALVKKMNYSVGDAKVAVQDYVQEGDILVSGLLEANEAITDQVCATGTVYGEVWYTTRVSLPLQYEVKQETGKKRWNFMVSKGNQDSLLFRPRLEHYENEVRHLFSLFGYEFSFVIQKEVTISSSVYSEEDALQKSLALVDEKFSIKLSKGEEVIEKKVLKKSMNNSTMDIEVFVSVLEVISRQEEFQEIEEEGRDNDTKSTN